MRRDREQHTHGRGLPTQLALLVFKSRILRDPLLFVHTYSMYMTYFIFIFLNMHTLFVMR